MKTIGAYEAKTHLPKLLARTSAGESFTITKNGMPVAQLTPPAQRTPVQQRKIRKAIRGLEKFSDRGLTLGSLSLRALREEGRR